MQTLKTKKQVQQLTEIQNICKVNNTIVKFCSNSDDLYRLAINKASSLDLSTFQLDQFKLEVSTLLPIMEHIKVGSLTNPTFLGNVSIVFISEDIMNQYSDDVILELYRHEIGHIMANHYKSLIKLHSKMPLDVKLSKKLELEADSYTLGTEDYFSAVKEITLFVVSDVSEEDMKIINHELYCRHHGMNIQTEFIPL